MNNRVLVCLSSNPPQASVLLAYGHNLAERLKTDWYVLHVDTPDENPERIDSEKQRHLLNAIEKAYGMGAEVFRIKSSNPVNAVLGFSQNQQIGHIVIGRFRKSPMQRLLGRSVMMKVIEKSWHLNVHLPSSAGQDDQ